MPAWHNGTRRNWHTDCGVDESIEFQYGLSRLLVGDLQECERICGRLIAGDPRIEENHLQPPNGYDYNLFAAAHLHLLAPQGTPCPPEITQWISDEQEYVSYRESLRSLIYFRAGMFERVLEEEPPRSGSDWFLRAMAEQHVGRASDARESFARGMRWLTRQTNRDRTIGAYGAAVGLLEAEVLRREAERLICK